MSNKSMYVTSDNYRDIPDQKLNYSNISFVLNDKVLGDDVRIIIHKLLVNFFNFKNINGEIDIELSYPFAVNKIFDLPDCMDCEIVLHYDSPLQCLNKTGADREKCLDKTGHIRFEVKQKIAEDTYKYTKIKIVYISPRLSSSDVYIDQAKYKKLVNNANSALSQANSVAISELVSNGKISTENSDAMDRSLKIVNHVSETSKRGANNAIFDKSHTVLSSTPSQESVNAANAVSSFIKNDSSAKDISLVMSPGNNSIPIANISGISNEARQSGAGYVHHKATIPVDARIAVIKSSKMSGGNVVSLSNNLKTVVNNSASPPPLASNDIDIAKWIKELPEQAKTWVEQISNKASEYMKDMKKTNTETKSQTKSNFIVTDTKKDNMNRMSDMRSVRKQTQRDYVEKETLTTEMARDPRQTEIVSIETIKTDTEPYNNMKSKNVFGGLSTEYNSKQSENKRSENKRSDKKNIDYDFNLSAQNDIFKNQNRIY